MENYGKFRKGNFINWSRFEKRFKVSEPFETVIDSDQSKLPLVMMKDCAVVMMMSCWQWDLVDSC